MSKKSGNVLLSPEQKLELGLAMTKAIPWDMSPELAQKCIGSRFLKSGVRQLLMPSEPERSMAVLDADSVVGQFAEEWERLYRDKFGLTADFSQVRVPVVPTNFSGFNWLMFVAKGLTPNAVYAVCESMFPCYRYISDLDAAVKGRNDREPIEHYAVWLRDRAEPDEELKKLSANQLAAYGVAGNTLLEALLLEPWYFSRSKGQHLNVANWNLCSGSRCSDGRVPHVGWRDGKFRVYCCSSDGANGNLRARLAVS
ncbi:MAG: hypothetical protein AAB358_03265 [Patescibacteria group bacterium]